MIFFRPFFLFLLLERSLSLASSESSLFAEGEELDCPCASSFTCAGGGSVGSAPLSVGCSSLPLATAVGFNSFGSAAAAVPALGCPNGEPPAGPVVEAALSEAPS